MGSTRMFRDRVVSLEQTYEQGEKHLALLQRLVAEAIPDLEFIEYSLDHEHDCFVMLYRCPDGAAKRVTWTRMMLYDAERIPAIADNTDESMRARVVDYLRERAARPVIAVTFRHLEEGWIDTPEPRRSRGRGRRSGAKGRRGRGPEADDGARRRAPAPMTPPAAASGSARQAPPPQTAGSSPTSAARSRKRRRRRRRGRGGPAAPGGGSGPGEGRPD